MTVARPVDVRGSAADVVYVLCLMQAAFLLLAGLGETLLMGGNPAYLVLPMAKLMFLIVLAAKVVSRRRWAMVMVIIVQVVTLIGFWLQLAASVLPMLTVTANLVGLLTNLVLPVTIIWLCAKLLSERSLELARERSPGLRWQAGVLPSPAPTMPMVPTLPMTQSMPGTPMTPMGGLR